ncbi:potassium channel family protein [Agromyces sp. ZXT2-6]|uniref:potassium channel family protein n=1 Tax=Agromyces sp. ZXT2-6 TaxID=3461153 RepID=UPI004054E5EE
MSDGGVERRQRWVDATGRWLALLGIAFIVAYTTWVLVPDLPAPVVVVFNVVFGVTWLMFLLDAVMRLALTPRGERWRYAWRHPIELLSVIFPVFRALRVVSLLGYLPVLQRRTTEAVRARFILTAIIYATVYVFFIALAVLQAERDAPGANITSFGESVWWAVVTLATVGYGDTYPVTVLGRMWAVFLMAGGVAIVGVASATIISVLNERLVGLRRGGPGGGSDMIAARPALDEPEPTGGGPVDPPDAPHGR